MTKRENSQVKGRINRFGDYVRPNQRMNGKIQWLERTKQCCSSIRIGLTKIAPPPPLYIKTVVGFFGFLNLRTSFQLVNPAPPLPNVSPKSSGIYRYFKQIITGFKEKLGYSNFFSNLVASIKTGFQLVASFALKGILGMLFLLSVFSIDDANAQCTPSPCLWFELDYDSGPELTIVDNRDSYDRTIFRYHFWTSTSHSTFMEYVVSERINGGNWTHSAKKRGDAPRSDYADVGINQAIQMSIPMNPLGHWYITGSAAHNNNIRYTFVPDKDAVNGITKGNQIEVRIEVKLFRAGENVKTQYIHLRYANYSSTTLSWEDNSSANLISDGTPTYGELDGLITNTPTGRFPMLFGGYERKPDGTITTAVVGNTKEITSKYGGWDVPVGENFQYGLWIISRHGDKFLFRPNSVEINKLEDNQVVISELEMTPHDGSSNPIGDKVKIKVAIGKVGISVDWSDDVELNSDGNPIITLDDSSNYEDLHATLRVVKMQNDYYHGGADDYLNDAMKIDGSNGPASGDLDADNLPTGFVQADTRVYGRGWSTGAGEHRGGVWFFDGKKELVAFRPIKERLDKLEAGDVIKTSLNLNLKRGGASITLTVVIRASAPVPMVSMTKGATTDTTLKLNFSGIDGGACIKLRITQGREFITGLESTASSALNLSTAPVAGNDQTVLTLDTAGTYEPTVTVTVTDPAGQVAIVLVSNPDNEGADCATHGAKPYVFAPNDSGNPDAITHRFGPDVVTMTKGETTDTTLKLNFSGLSNLAASCIKLNISRGRELITGLKNDGLAGLPSLESGNIQKVLAASEMRAPVLSTSATVSVRESAIGVVKISLEMDDHAEADFCEGVRHTSYRAAANQVVTHRFGPEIVSMSKGETTDTTLKLNFSGIDGGACIKLNVVQGRDLITGLESTASSEYTQGTAPVAGNSQTMLTVLTLDDDAGTYEPIVTVTVGAGASGTVEISLENNDNSCSETLAKDYVAAVGQVAISHRFGRADTVSMTKGATTETTLKLNFSGIDGGACIKLVVTQGRSLITGLESTASSTYSLSTAPVTGNDQTVLTLDSSEYEPTVTVTVVNQAVGTISISLISNDDTCSESLANDYVAATNQTVTHKFGVRVTMTKGQTTETTFNLNFSDIDGGACIKLIVTRGRILITGLESTASSNFNQGTVPAAGNSQTVLTLDDASTYKPTVTVTVGEKASGTVEVSLESNPDNDDANCAALGAKPYVAAAGQVVAHTFGSLEDLPNVPASGTACHEVVQPAEVVTPNTHAYFKQIPEVVYKVAGTGFVRPAPVIGFRNPNRASHKAAFYVTAYDVDGVAIPSAAYEEHLMDTTQDSLTFDRIGIPSGHRGFARYSIAPRGLGGAPQQWYGVVSPCDFHVWWTDSSKPGIEISIEESTIEEYGSFVVKATATPKPALDIKIPVSFSIPSLVQNPQDRSITIRAGQESATFTVNVGKLPVGSSVEAIAASAVNSVDYWLDESVRKATVVVSAVEVTNAVGFSDDSLAKTVLESAGSVELTITMQNVLTTDVTVTYSLEQGGTAILGDDFEIPTYTTTITKDETSQSITLPILTDSDENEGLEYFEIELTGVTGEAQLGSNTTARVTIVETNQINFSHDSLEKTVLESAGSVELKINLTNVLTTDVTVIYSLGQGGTATLGVDFSFVPNPNFATIEKGQTFQKITVPILADSVENEDLEYFEITLTQALGDVVQLGSNKTARVTIAESSLVNFSDDSLKKTVLEPKGSSVGSVELSINMSNALTTAVTVDFSLEPGGNATLGADFVVPAFTTTIAKGQTTLKMILYILPDTDANEDLEYFDIALTTVTGDAQLGSNTTARVTIAEANLVNFADDSLDKTVLESDGSVELAINLLVATTTDVTVTYILKPGGTATLDSDFQIPTYSATIEQGKTSQKITLTILEDSANNEGLEYFEISLTPVSGNTSVKLGLNTTARISIVGSNLVNFSDDDLIKTVMESEGSVDLTVNLLKAVAADVEVFYTLKPGGTATLGADFRLEGFSVRIMKGQTSQTITLEIISDAQSESVENFEISLLPVTTGGVQLGTKNTAQIFIVDPDPISITAESRAISAGDVAEFTVSIHPPPRENLPVPLTISQTSDLVLLYAPRHVHFRATENTASFSIATNPDAATGGSINISVGPYINSTDKVSVDVTSNPSSNGTKYSVASSVITMILREIPHTAPQDSSNFAKPTLTIRSVKVIVEEGESAVFTISTLDAVSSDIPVRIELGQSGDFVLGPMRRSVELKEDTFATELLVKTDDDELAELDGRITATIQDGGGYLVGAENTAHVIVSDALDRQSRRNGVSNALNAMLPDLLANSTARTVGIASERVRQAFSGSPTTSIELNGISPAMTILKSGGEMLNDSSTDWRSIIDDSSFTVALYPEGGETSLATAWGVGDRWSLSGDGIGGQQSWDGETHSGHFGFDSRIGHGVLTGLAMSISQSEVDVEQRKDAEMSFGTLTTGIHPYLGLFTPDGNSQLQIMTGYGVSELELKQEKYPSETLTGNYHTVSLGGSNRFYSNRNFGDGQNLDLSMSGEVWHSQQSVNSVAGVVDNLQVRASHLEISIEAASGHYLGVAGSIGPAISIGIKGESRNEKTVFGLDIASEVKYEAFNGLEIVGLGGTMLSGINRVHRWKIGSLLNYDSSSDGKGVLFSMAPTWGESDSDIERDFFGSDYLTNSNQHFDSGKSGNIEAEIGYGFEILDEVGIMVPYAAFNQTNAQGNDIRVGSRIAIDSELNFELSAVRDSLESGIVGQEYNLTGIIRW